MKISLSVEDMNYLVDVFNKETIEVLKRFFNELQGNFVHKLLSLSVEKEKDDILYAKAQLEGVERFVALLFSEIQEAKKKRVAP